jgi:outer membrane protein assembly factor BamB
MNKRLDFQDEPALRVARRTKEFRRSFLIVLAIVTWIAFAPAKGFCANVGGLPTKTEPAWPMFQHNPSHTSRSNFSTASNPGTRKWEFSTTSMLMETSPAVGADGTIYVGTDDYLRGTGGSLCAINPDGTLKWKFATAGGVRMSPAIATDGTIYFAAEDCGGGTSLRRILSHSCLYALNPDGKVKWQFDTRDPLYASSPIVAADGTIYIGNDGGALFAINSDGTLKWKFGTGDAVGVPAIGRDGTIYVNSKDGKVYALEADSKLKWKFEIGGKNFPASPSIGLDGTIYVGSYHMAGAGNGEDYLYAIDPHGTQKWKFATGGVVMSAPALASDGTIYITGGREFYAISPAGVEKWKLQIRPQSAPAIGGDGTIYFESFPANFTSAAAMDSVYAINPDGTIKWQSPIDNKVSGSPAIGADGTVYVAAEDNKVYAFGKATTSTSVPASLDFGSSPLWNSVTRTFTITNTGGTSLFIQGLSFPRRCGFNEFSLGASNCPPAALSPGARCTIAVTFSPLATGARNVPLTITDSAGSGSQIVALRGTGTPDLTTSTETLAWNRVKAGTSRSQSLTVTNHQTITVALAESIGGASGRDFAIVSGSCGNRLAANSSCTIEVSFSPATPGGKSAVLSVFDNPDAISPYEVTLTGSGA